MATLLPRRVAGTISSLLLAVVAVAALAGPAQAEEGYEYWNYFHLEKDKWAFAQVGPADYKPKDGAVEGFRYGTSTPSQGIEPRADLEEVSFDAVCGETDAEAGEKRVAVVIDYGTELGNGTPPEPRAVCAVADEADSTQSILDRVTDVRVDNNMTCGIDGYPASGCGEPVKDAEVATDEQPVAFALPSDGNDAAATNASASQDAEDGGQGGLWAAIGAGVLVLLIAVGALAMSRRSKTA